MMSLAEEFGEQVDKLGEERVAGVLGFRGDPDAPEDLGELMIDAFDGLSVADQEQAIRKLAMQRRF